MKLGEVMQPDMSVPLSKWDTPILAWSAGYWEGKARTCPQEGRRQFRRWSNEARAELVARKLRE